MAFNPFAALLQNTQQNTKNDNENVINELLENIFEITLNSEFNNAPKEPSFVFLGDSESSEFLTTDNLDDVREIFN